MSAARGAALLAEFIRRGTLGTDPAAILDLLDLCRLAGVDPMQPDHTAERHPLCDSFDRVCAERDRLATELARSEAVLREFEQRAAADREQALRRVRELEAEVRRLSGDPLDMTALLEQPADVVGLGSRTGDAVALLEARRDAWRRKRGVA